MSHDCRTDADDVQETLAGKREAFGRLYDRHAAGVRAVVAAVSRDFRSVEDLTQESFLRGYRQLSSLRDPNGFRQWIHGIARLVAREHLRELRRNREHSVVDNELETSNVKADVVELNEEQEKAMSAIAALPERERLAIHAYYFLKQDADQAAVTVGLSRSGFYAALERGMQRLRRRLGALTLPPTNERNKK